MTAQSPRRRIVFAGTPEFAATVLQALLDDGQDIIACYTQPDRPAGRGRKLTPPPVKALAADRGIPVFQPLNFKADEDVAQLADLGADMMIVVAYGLILPQRVLDIPPQGCINVHASLLPRWRGAAPIQRAILAGDDETGVTLMRMEAGLDTGPMLATVVTPISATDIASSLHDRLATLGSDALVAFLRSHPDILPPGRVQPVEGVTYAAKLSKDESMIDWQQPAHVLDRHVRGLHGWPVAQTILGNDVLRVWQAHPAPPGSPPALPGTVITADRQGIAVATGEGSLVITQLQLPGGKALAVADILNSRAAQFAPGVRLGAS